MPGAGHDASQVLAARLKELRAKAGLSQDELARAARVSRAYLSDLERANKEAGVSVIVRLSHALSVPPGALLQGATTTAVGTPERRPRKSRLTPAERLGQQVTKLAEGADEASLKRFATVVKAFFPKKK